jgi:hypothetical protein
MPPPMRTAGRARGCRRGKWAPAAADAGSGPGGGSSPAACHDRDRPARHSARHRLGDDPGHAGHAGCRRRYLARCQASPDPRASASLILASARPPRFRAGRRCRRRDPSWAYRSAALRSSRPRWRASSSLRYGMVLTLPGPSRSSQRGRARSWAAGWHLAGRAWQGRMGWTRLHPRDGGPWQHRPVPAGGDRRRGRAPWPGRYRDPGGRAEGPHARGARAGPSASGYGFVSLSSPRSVATCRARLMRSHGRAGTVLRGTVRAGTGGGRHPKVRMPVESSVAGPGARRCLRAGPGTAVLPGVGCGCRVRGSGRAGGRG